MSKQTTRKSLLPGKGDYAKVTHVSAEEAARAEREEREILKAAARGNERGKTPMTPGKK